MRKVFAATLLCATAAMADGAAVVPASSLGNYTFEQYVADFGRAFSGDEVALRRATFEHNLALIREHNAKPGRTWEAGVNRLTDRTPAEFRRMMGFNKAQARSAVSASAGAAEWQPKGTVGQLPDSVDWRQKKAVTAVKDQGSCGSCWSFGAAETIESHWAIKSGDLLVLSEQNILDCTPNPRKCGGTGGCNGGTAELAFARMKEGKGIALEAKYPYRSGTTGQDYPCHYDPSVTPQAVNVTGFVKLPGNKYDPVMQAIATVGPLAINVAANTGWQLYSSGVFNECDQTNPDVNHVVQLVGYGADAQHGNYWLVRNSWSATWGESGYIRIARTASEETRCGVDKSPQDGVACEGDPPTAVVCGTCGVIYDVSYPTV